MIQIHDVVRSRLGSLVAGRVWPNRFPQETGAPTWPAIRVTIVSADTAGTICGSDDESTDDTRVQIDIVGDLYSDVQTLRGQVIAALMTTEPPCTRQSGGFETFDAETKTHRASIDFTFYPSTDSGDSPP